MIWDGKRKSKEFHPTLKIDYDKQQANYLLIESIKEG